MLKYKKLNKQVNKKMLMAEAIKNGLLIPQIAFFLDVTQLESNLLCEIRSACSQVKHTISGGRGVSYYTVIYYVIWGWGGGIIYYMKLEVLESNLLFLGGGYTTKHNFTSKKCDLGDWEDHF